MRASLSLRLSLSLAAVLWGLSSPVFAQMLDEPAGAFFRQEWERERRKAQSPVRQRPTKLIRRAAPVPGFTVDAPHETTTETPAAESPTDKPVQEAAPVAQPSEPRADGSFAIAVLGDSLGTLLAQGLTEAFSDRREVAVLRRARDGSGLVRDDWYNWMTAARDLLASEKISAGVMMIGSNDRQQIRDNGIYIDVLTPRWKELYGQRVATLAQLFAQKKVPLYWIGLPVTRSERFAADMSALNSIAREEVSKAGGIFIDIWDAFLDDRGQFTNYGPDVNGQFQRLRSGDGLHFTRAGARKAAYFVETELRRQLQDAQPRIDPVVAPVDPRMTREPAPLPSSPAPEAIAPSDPLAALPALAPIPDVFIPVKPAAGQVAPLTGPVVSRGGELATQRRRSAAPNEAELLLDRTLVQGRPPEPRPGRADDFSWPRRP